MSRTLRACAGLFGLLAVAAPLAAQRTYVAFGDSITNGYGDSVTGDQAGYPPRLERLLADGSVVRKHGEDGAKISEQGLDEIDGVLALGGDVLLLAYGTNDVSTIARGDYSLETVLFNYREVVRRAEAAGFSVIHVTAIPRRPDAKFDGNNLLNQEFNQEIRHLAGTTGRDLVDNFEVFSTQSDLFGSLYLEGQDAVGHPNSAGYDIMAQTYFEVIRGLDRVPPVPGRTFPNNGDTDVSSLTSIQLDVWDFGTGINLNSTQLLVNGIPVTTSPTGLGERLQFDYTPADALSGTVNVGLRSSDLASPPNTYDRLVTRFTVSGSQALQGDVDGDGRVDGADLIQMALAFGASSGSRRYDPASDLNGDGIVDGSDLAILGSSFGRGQ